MSITKDQVEQMISFVIRDNRISASEVGDSILEKIVNGTYFAFTYFDNYSMLTSNQIVDYIRYMFYIHGFTVTVDHEVLNDCGPDC